MLAHALYSITRNAGLFRDPYKKSSSENIINQGLFYLNWLLDHQAEFTLLVMKKISPDAAKEIDFANARVLCIASDFTRYDEHAIGVMGRSIELIRYRMYLPDLVLLEAASLPAAFEPGPGSSASSPSLPNAPGGQSEVPSQMSKLNAATLARLDELRGFTRSLGDDVEEKMLKWYFRYRRLRNFASIELGTKKQAISLYLVLDPQMFADRIAHDPGQRYRDVSAIGHMGTGDLEFTIRADADLDDAKKLIEAAYRG
ncbi:MAG: DUF91 domain-containing protein [Phycisphaerales bacterium]|nr:DUF91 domain-containing protein [Phycisphaerales bacterium]